MHGNTNVKSTQLCLSDNINKYPKYLASWNCCLMVCDAVYCGRKYPMSLKNLLLPPSL